jgi:hypothetical protein
MSARTTRPCRLGAGGVRAGLSHVHRIASHLRPGRDDVVERDQHAELAVECDPQHAVEVRIGDQEAATVGLQRVLETGRDEVRKGNGRRIGIGLNAPMSATTVKLSEPPTRYMPSTSLLGNKGSLIRVTSTYSSSFNG